MKEAIGATWILGIVTTFIVLFASFLAISINYSKAFKVKNNIVDLIEKNEGMNEETAKEIYDYLRTEGYILKGKCKQPSTGPGIKKFVGFDGENPVGYSEKALYCVQQNTPNSITELDKSYYSVQIFFRLDLPLIGEIFTFNVSGETMSIYYPNNGAFETRLSVEA